MKHVRTLTAALCLTLLLAAGYHYTSAQEFESREEGTISIEAGTVFEMLAIVEGTTPQFSWVLTENREFVEAGRGPVFRVRLTKPGDYFLDASVFLPTEQRGIRKPIKLTVTAPANLPTGTGATPVPSATTPLVTEPPLRNTTIFLQTDLLKMQAGTMEPPLSLDIDAAADANGDGDASNDNLSERTFFQENGSSLMIWFATPQPERSFMISSPTAQPIRIAIRSGGEDGGGEPQIVSSEGENGAMHFSVENPPTGTPLLYRWDFGDGNAALLDEPTYTYSRNGNYPVRVEIIDLKSGTEIIEVETNVQVTTVPAVPVTPPEEEPPEEGGMSFGWLWTVLRYVLWLLFFAAIGLGITYLIGRFRKGGGGLQKKLEEIESSIMKKEPDTKSVIDAPPPMELKRVEKTEKPAAPKEESKKAAPTPPPPAPAPQATEAPSWLKKGLEKTAEPEKKAVLSGTPTVPPPAPAPAPKPTPTPARSDASDVPPPPAPKPVTPSPKPVEPPKPTPVPAPAPKPAPSPPPPPPKPAETPKPAEPPKPAPIPPPARSGMPDVPRPAPKPPEALPVPPKEEMLTPPPKAEALPPPKDDDEPIAFIRADSIEETPPEPPKA